MKITEKNIQDFAKENKITPGILIGRLQNDGLLKYNEFNDLIIRI